MTPSYPFPSTPGVLPKRSAWLPVVCPVCCGLARALPAGRDVMAIACAPCGDYRLSWAAQRMFDAQPATIDRAQLSEVVHDTCLMTECDWPLIDGLTATALLGMATLPQLARAFSPSAASGAAAP